MGERPIELSTRILRDFKDLREFLFETQSSGPFFDKTRPVPNSIYNGFLKQPQVLDLGGAFVVLTPEVVVGVGPREPASAPASTSRAAPPPPSIRALLEAWRKYHVAIWEWYDRKPGPGGDISEWLDDMPPTPRPL